MADFREIVAEILVVRAGDGQSLAALAGIDGHEEVDIVGCRLEFLAEHGRDNNLQCLEQVGLGAGTLAHVDFLGDGGHGEAVVDILGVDTQIDGFLRGQQAVHFLGHIDPVLVGPNSAAILVQLVEVDGAFLFHDGTDSDLVIALLLVLDPDGRERKRGDGGDHGIRAVLAVLEAHTANDGGILVGGLGQAGVDLESLIDFTGLHGLIVRRSQLFGRCPQLHQFLGVLFSRHGDTLLFIKCELIAQVNAPQLADGGALYQR